MEDNPRDNSSFELARLDKTDRMFLLMHHLWHVYAHHTYTRPDNFSRSSVTSPLFRSRQSVLLRRDTCLVQMWLAGETLQSLPKGLRSCSIRDNLSQAVSQRRKFNSRIGTWQNLATYINIADSVSIMFSFNTEYSFVRFSSALQPQRHGQDILKAAFTLY